MSNSKLTNGQCGICANCAPQINGGSGFNNCEEAHAAQLAEDGMESKRKAAVATLEHHGFTWHGGEQWKPPLGLPPAFASNDRAELQEYRKAAGEPALYASEETLLHAKRGELHLRCLSEPMGDAVIPLYRHAQPAPAVEPVGYFYADKPGDWYQISDGDRVPSHRRIPLYANPQSSPAVKLPNELISGEGIVVQIEKLMAVLAVHGIPYERRGNTCRAAMLKGDKS